MFGLGKKTIELLSVMTSECALTQKQCDAVCKNGIHTLERHGLARYCKACRRYEIDMNSELIDFLLRRRKES